jgi:hypothetical protein
MKKLLIAVALLFLTAGSSYAQRLQWSNAVKYDTGTLPAVSMNSSGVVIEVHQSEKENKLYYHVGKLNPSTGVVTWGRSWDLPTKGEARRPSVAITQNSSVIVVFEKDLRLRYLTATLNPTGPVDQQLNIVVPDTQYDSGNAARISVNASGTLMEVHQDNLSDRRLSYRLGDVDLNTNAPNIAWRGPSTQFESGSEPDISVDDRSIFVEVHREKYGNNLHYRRGTIQGTSASFGPSYFLFSGPDPTGSYPSVALTNTGYAIALAAVSRNVVSQDGVVDDQIPSRIWWSRHQTVQSGASFKSLATNGDWAIGVYARGGSDYGWELRYSTARVP